MNQPAFVVLAELADVARAGVVAAALRAHHPQSPVFVVTSDGSGAPREREMAGAVRLAPDDLSMPGEVRRAVDACRRPERRHEALRPWALSAALDRTGRDVVEVPVDAMVLRAVADALDPGGEPVAVVARCVEAPPRDGLRPTAADLGLVGNVDDGVGRLQSHRDVRWILRWWKQDVAQALHTGTPIPGWRDVAAFAPAHVVRDPGLVVSAWNLHERPLQAMPQGISVGDAPLRVLRTGGLESGSAWPPGLAPAHHRRPHPGDDGLLAALIGEHLARVGMFRRARALGVA